MIQHVQIPLVGFSPGGLTSGQFTDTLTFMCGGTSGEKKLLVSSCQCCCLCASDPSRPHLFRVKVYNKPVWCQNRSKRWSKVNDQLRSDIPLLLYIPLYSFIGPAVGTFAGLQQQTGKVHTRDIVKEKRKRKRK